MRYVLDTNIAIGALNEDERVLSRLEEAAIEEVGLPLVVVAELLYGAEYSPRPEQNLARVNALRSSLRVLPMTNEIVELYAKERAALRKRGLTKTDFDLVIACTAIEYGATLVTHDKALLDGTIRGLDAQDWLSD